MEKPGMSFLAMNFILLFAVIGFIIVVFKLGGFAFVFELWHKAGYKECYNDVIRAERSELLKNAMGFTLGGYGNKYLIEL